ncbi:MAG TPA: hypothetical protein VGI79_02000 [Caulobacteraceae bacterium]|jgi:hypothetical protein
MPLLQEALSALDGKPELTEADALTVRKIVYGGDATISKDEAEALIQLNIDAGAASQAWRMLYVEALTDFVVRQQEPAGYVNEAQATWLMSAVSRDGCAKDDEIELIVHVLEEADAAPAALSAFVIDAVRNAVLGRQGTGPIGKDDVERLRRTLFAVGGDGNVGVTRREAEALFDLNDAFRGAANDPAWTDLFVRAVANAVLYTPAYQASSAADELHRQAWLADNAVHPGGVLANWLHPPPGTFSFKSLFGRPDQDLRDRYAADDALELAAQEVTAEEGHWLLDRIGRDGRFDANEQALVRFLIANATKIDTSLNSMIARLTESQSADL